MESNEFQQALQQLQQNAAKVAGHQIEEIDKQYRFVESLDQEQLNALLKIMTAMYSVDGENCRAVAGFWAGYVRSARFHKFGVDPNPMTPSISEADFEALGED